MRSIIDKIKFIKPVIAEAQEIVRLVVTDMPLIKKVLAGSVPVCQNLRQRSSHNGSPMFYILLMEL
jgi:hypothetical protein